MISVTPSTTLGKRLFQFAFGEWLSATTKLKFYSSGLLPRFFTRDFASSTGKSVYGGFTEIDGDWPRIMRTNLPLESAAQFAGLYGHLHLTGAFRRIEFAESVIRVARRGNDVSFFRDKRWGYVGSGRGGIGDIRFKSGV